MNLNLGYENEEEMHDELMDSFMNSFRVQKSIVYSLSEIIESQFLGFYKCIMSCVDFYSNRWVKSESWKYRFFAGILNSLMSICGILGLKIR